MNPSIIDLIKAAGAAGGEPVCSIGAVHRFVGKNYRHNIGDRIGRQYDFMTGDATEIGNDFTVKATVAVSGATITSTTAGSSADDAGLTSKAACFLRADEPFIGTKCKISTLTAAKLEFGFYVDSNNFCLITYDPTATISANLFLNLNVASTAQTQDLGIVMDTNYHTLEMALNTAGKPYLVVDGTYYPLNESVTNRMPATASKLYAVITEQAAAAKVMTTKYLEYSINK